MYRPVRCKSRMHKEKVYMEVATDLELTSHCQCPGQQSLHDITLCRINASYYHPLSISVIGSATRAALSW